MIAVALARLATTLTSATSIVQDILDIMALEGQPNKLCGTSDHFDVNSCSNRALAELAQVMFDQFLLEQSQLFNTTIPLLRYGQSSADQDHRRGTCTPMLLRQ